MNKLRKSKLIAGLITKLSPDDLTQLHRFLKSPYHNTNKNLPVFFKAICQYYPDFDNDLFTAENIFRKVYKDREFNEATFRGLKTDLTKKVIAFFAHEAIRQDKDLEQSLVVKSYANRNAYSSFLNVSASNIKALEEKEDKHLQDFENLRSHYHDLFFHPETARDSPLADHNISACMENLDQFYFFAKIMYSIELLTRNNFRENKHKIRLLDKAIQHGRQTKLSGNKLFNWYVLLVSFIKSPQEASYTPLIKYLFSNHKDIPHEGQMLASVILVNFAFAKYQSGDAQYLEQLNALHKFRDRQNLLLSNNRISSNSFINVIISMASNGELEWAAYFKDKYAPHLNHDMRDDILRLSRAYLHFYKSEYLDTVAELNDIENKNLAINLRYRSLSIRAFYELSLLYKDYEDELEKRIRRFIAFLKGKELSKQRKRAYKNFCLCCLDLLYDKQENMLNRIERQRSLIFKSWLLEKVKVPEGMA